MKGKIVLVETGNEADVAFTFFCKVRQGGCIIVPETTYRRLP